MSSFWVLCTRGVAQDVGIFWFGGEMGTAGRGEQYWNTKVLTRGVVPSGHTSGCLLRACYSHFQTPRVSYSLGSPFSHFSNSQLNYYYYPLK